MKVLITGGSGFIAGHVAEKFFSRGYQVILQSRSLKCIEQNAKYIVIQDTFDSLDSYNLSDVSSIIHLASAGVSPKNASWQVLEAVNIAGTLQMCQLAKSLQVPILVAGSFCEYGRAGLSYSEIPVDAPLEPTFPYAISKAVSCSLAINYARFERIRLGYFRIFNAYGSGQSPDNLWPSLVSAALTGLDFDITPGEQIRDFVPVSLVAEQFFDAIDHDILRAGSPCLKNVASGSPQTIKEFCEVQWAHYSIGGKLNVGYLPYREQEVMRYVPSMKSMYV